MGRSTAGSCSVVTSCPKSFQAAMVGPHKREVGAPPLRWRGSPKRRQWRGTGPPPPPPAGAPRGGPAGKRGTERRRGARGGARPPPPPAALQYQNNAAG